MKFSASAAFFLLVCVVCIQAYRPYRPATTVRPVHPWRPTHRPSPHRPQKTANSNYNVNVNTNKNNNDNAMLASLMSQLFSNQDTQSPCTGGWASCYGKKASLRSDDAADATAAVIVEPATEKVAEKDAVATTAAAAAGDFDFDQFAQPQFDDDVAEDFEESEDDDMA